MTHSKNKQNKSKSHIHSVIQIWCNVSRAGRIKVAIGTANPY